MPRTAAQTREHVLEVARDLFYWHGIRAIGVDRVAAEAGVAPTTLYRLFTSKDDLVAAYVERADERYREWFTAAAAAGAPDPRDQILSIFDALAEQVKPQAYRGCPFLMALSEFADPGLPAHRNAVAAKAWVRASFGELVGELAATGRPVDDPAALADQLTLVVEGVYASVQALGDDGPAGEARSLVERLLG